MLLTYSIGNDNILLGLFSEDILTATMTVSTELRRTSDEYACIIGGIFEMNGIKASDIDGAICSSVVPTLTETVRAAMERLLGFKPHILGVGTKTGLRILTDDPTQLGADLVASAVGALADYKPPMILVDFGTAITFSVIDSDGGFSGCAIAPGLTLSAEALSSNTSLLPHFAHTAPKRCIGTNTAESMRSGCVFGACEMVSGMIRRIEAELGETCTVIVSGRDADIIAPLCERETIADDALLLKGLCRIFAKNSRGSKK